LPFAVCRLLFAGTRCDPQQAYPIVSGIHLASARPLRVLSKSANWCNKVFTRMRYALTPATHRHWQRPSGATLKAGLFGRAVNDKGSVHWGDSLEASLARLKLQGRFLCWEIVVLGGYCV